MAMARRAVAELIYRGLPIQSQLLDFTYSDNYDQTDDLRVSLSDRDMLWLGDMFPMRGENLHASISVFDWDRNGDDRSFDFGIFEIDDVSWNGVVSLSAAAVPISGSGRSEKKHRTWKRVSLSAIAADISGNVGVSLIYDTNTDPFYDVADQIDKSDLAYLEELCKSDGLCMKITDGQLIIYEESKYESEPAVKKIIRGSSDVIGEPSFRRQSKEVFRACLITHYDPKTDQVYEGYFEAPDAENIGHTLVLRERFNSVNDDMSLSRKSRVRLRERNRDEWTCNINLKGDVVYFSGVNVELEGWGCFDGKYHITNAGHSISSGGYSVSLRTRRCLEGY